MSRQGSAIAGSVLLAFLIAVASLPVGAKAPPDDVKKTKGVYAVKKKTPGQDPQAPPPGALRRPAGAETPTPGPRSMPGPNPRPTPQPGRGQVDPGAGITYPTDRVLSRRLGSDGLQQLLAQMESMQAASAAGRGAPMASVWFDGARVRSGGDDGVRPSGTRFFQPARLQSRNDQSSPVIDGAAHRATVQDSRQTTGLYGSIPGGVVLEGGAAGLGGINGVRYDGRFNAFIFGDSAAYFMRVPPKTVAVLCRAIAADDKERVGVSLGEVELVYGKVPPDSELAWDLKIADRFLGGIVFARSDWTAGYRFAHGFKPEPNRGESFAVAVFFVFNGFQFQTRQEEVLLARASFLARLFPLSQTRSSDGGLLPDDDAIFRGHMSEQYELNARHLAENIAYYRRERIIDRVFAYGEVAAVLRELKRDGFDLEDLADHIPGGR